MIVLAVMAWLVIDIATNRILSAAVFAIALVLGAYFWLRDRGKPQPEPSRELVHVPRSVLGDGRGNVPCTRCKTIVSYATMSLNEHGSFCAPCAAGLRAA